MGLLLFVASCAKDPYIDSASVESQDSFLSAKEAQAFFEHRFTEQQTRSAGENVKKFLDPGVYTPQWEDAATSQNDALGSVDIPILAQYKYRAIRSEFKNGKAKAYTVEMPQKLVVVKSKKTKSIAQYVLTLIPDKEYYEKNKNLNILNRFLNSGDKDEFSGYALYTLNGFPARLSKYKKGEKIAGASIIGITDKATITKRLKTILRELGKMKIQRMEQAELTRSWGEDDDYSWYDWLEDNWDDIPDDTTFYFDDDGNVYVDSNNDGDCDDNELIWIGDGNDDTSTDPDPDSTDDNTDENEDSWSCDCGCCSECGYCGVCSSCDPPEAEPCDCDDCAECGYDNQQSKDDTPKDLSDKHGADDYYKERYEDAKRRGIDPPPSYYLEYGDKYYNRFKDLKQDLSLLGSKWVDDTAFGLHVAMTNLLEDNPEIERDEAALKSLAFETHADVYIESGITNLPWGDAFLISIQVDLTDWFSTEAIAQAVTVGAAYIKDKSYDKAMEFMQNYNYLEQLIEQKIIDSATGTRSGPAYTAKDYIDAHFGELIECYEQNYSDFELPN